MKKIILAVALMAAVSTSAVAETNYKPSAGSFATELNYSFGGATDGAFELPDQDNYGIKLRYFLSDNMVVRLNFGLGTSSNKTTNYTAFYQEHADPNTMRPIKAGEYEDVTTSKTTTFSIMPGFEYHFDKFNRISPYIGAELGVRTAVTKNVTENEARNNWDASLNKENTPESRTESKQPGVGFRFNLLTGCDVYITEGLYMGVELGLGYDMMSYKRGTTTTEVGDTTEEKDGSSSNRKSSFKFSATPSLRIGWVF